MKQLLIPALSLLLITCGKKPEETAIETDNISVSGDSVLVTPAQSRASGIEVGQIELRSLSGSIPVTGTLDVPPQNMVNITAPLGGFLRSTSLLQGTRVTRGQVIAVIENPDYIQLQQDYLDSRSQVNFLEKEYERQAQLAAENVNAQKTLQKSLADLESMKAKNSGLKAKLSLLGINGEELRPESILSSINLTSPITGYVTRVNSSIGAFVAPTDVMITIVDTEHLHAELVCFERDIPRIRVGQKIRFQLAHEATERTATVFLIGREINPDRTVRVHGHLDKEDRELMPGMYLKAVIQTGSASLPSLPEEAVLNFEDKEIIFIQLTDEIYHMVEVTTGIRENGFAEVIVPEGMDISRTRVVIRNAYKLLSKLKSSDEE
jgi:membrane fusion protein, heavy metal efflux system